ncbi:MULTISPECIES: hypothetical protein [Marinobacter]|uniref:Uncharacterized protein n=1 Tax=Marinobacter xiaoshiensis TaxID=3073652 RepID=A0ABU2HJH3_9GAMM|nr:MULTISPECIES: hypothetical protein [unclassified Marinobacter]MDS1310790.1 hypothetical protein [Marinobacter sp. F60267]
MSRTRIFLAMLAMAQVKAIEAPCYLKASGAAQTRTEMMSHLNPFYGQWRNTHNAERTGDFDAAKRRLRHLSVALG